MKNIPNSWSYKHGNNTHFKTSNGLHNTNYENTNKQIYGRPPPIPINCEGLKPDWW
jgi:hypothetical protein